MCALLNKVFTFSQVINIENIVDVIIVCFQILNSQSTLRRWSQQGV